MREILFRGKDRKGEWVYGNYAFTDNNGEQHFVFQNEAFANKVIPETVGQYTGLTDKNDKKIFEDDIVKCDDDVGAVSYSDLFAKFRVTYNEITGNWFDFEGENCCPIMFDCEVIGNIHDNPELLGGNYCGQSIKT